MDQLWLFRVWMAFIAFMDLSTGMRCYVENKSFLNEILISDSDDGEFTATRIFGAYSFLKALALFNCTLNIQYKPVVSMGVCSLFSSIVLYLIEGVYFGAAAFHSSLVVPCMLNVFTLCGLIYLPIHLRIWEEQINDDEKDTIRAEFLRRERIYRHRKSQ